MLYGENHAFFITAPKGWVLDNSSGVNQGLHAVFYPLGGSWQHSPTVMYANGIDIDSTETLESFIDGDIKVFKENHQGINAIEIDSIHVEECPRVARVVKFYGGSYPDFESVAYIKELKNISIFVMSCETEDEYIDNYSKFIELVKSYKNFGDKVIIKN